MIQGAPPRTTIGTVNTAEFLVTLAISASFITQLGLSAFSTAVVGLIIGGLLAAPLGAIIASRVTAGRLLVMVGLLLLASSLYSLWRAIA